MNPMGSHVLLTEEHDRYVRARRSKKIIESIIAYLTLEKES